MLPQHLTTTDYSHIELTEEETKEALNFARMRKARAQEEADNVHKRKIMIKAHKEQWTYEQLQLHVRQRIKQLPFRFVLDEHNNQVFHLLLQYFSNSPAFEENVYNDMFGISRTFSLKKGILLYSKERGTGKSVLMSLFAQNRKNCFVNVSTKKISSFFEQSGDEIIARFSRPWVTETLPQFFFQSPVGICFDDLGDEEIKSHYGNKENVMARILSTVYDECEEKNLFHYFHATTNLSGNELEQQYDKRVRSRLREMFNWIEVGGKDRRV